MSGNFFGNLVTYKSIRTDLPGRKTKKRARYVACLLNSLFPNRRIIKFDSYFFYRIQTPATVVLWNFRQIGTLHLSQNFLAKELMMLYSEYKIGMIIYVQSKNGAIGSASADSLFLFCFHWRLVTPHIALRLRSAVRWQGRGADSERRASSKSVPACCFRIHDPAMIASGPGLSGAAARPRRHG